MEYSYDSLGNRTAVQYPDGKDVSYEYDAASRLVQVRDWNNRETDYTYDAANRLATTTLPNGITSAYTYDDDNRVLRLVHSTSTDTLASYTYSMDAAGNRIQVVENAQQPSGAMQAKTISYGYDDLYRLETADYSTGESFQYTYDPAGNRLTQEVDGVETAYTYDAANRITSIGGVAYLWDDNGNLLSDGISAYEFDAANRLTFVTNPQAANTYQYNGLGDRVSQTVNGVTTHYTLDLNAALTQTLSDGANTYLYGTDRIGEQQPGGFSYHLPDALGSVRQLADGAAGVTRAQSFEPFGSVMAAAGGGGSIFGYVGEAKDATGLVYLRARYYSPALGRFFNRDPWVGNTQIPGTLHPYLYGFNNPLRYRDPSGMDFWDDLVRSIVDVGSLINWGRENEQNKDTILTEANAIRALNDYIFSPSMEAIRQSRIGLVNGLNAYGDAVEMMNSVVSYTANAVSEGRWEDAQRGFTGIRDMNDASRSIVAREVPRILTSMAVSVVTSPFTNAWDFGTAARECWEGKRSGWDVTYHGLISMADVLTLGLISPTRATSAVAEEAAGKVGILDDARFAQRTYNPIFSEGGTFAGKSVDDVAAALRSGILKPGDVPLDYIVRDGNILLLNTRSAQALEAAGIPRAQWFAVNRTGQEFFENLLTGQLQRNNLPSTGINTVRRLGGQ